MSSSSCRPRPIRLIGYAIVRGQIIAYTRNGAASLVYVLASAYVRRPRLLPRLCHGAAIVRFCAAGGPAGQNQPIDGGLLPALLQVEVHVDACCAPPGGDGTRWVPQALPLFHARVGHGYLDIGKVHIAGPQASLMLDLYDGVVRLHHVAIPFELRKRVLLQSAWSAGRSIFGYEPTTSADEHTRGEIMAVYTQLADYVKKRVEGGNHG